ncbi:hypothetical protein NWP17_00550 [Chrysosporum bergii ANA360D]|uniref:Uncharacterized protein n=1 Tax=Chrysosporum bergii ANA360D TaxID=617107 RepID=A0AA43K9J9_9CYAN|nr:hypothetical protein [Chrysosporum bergii]MDH6058949.1 hypothetical protein [Chrysosporum bergii ANA360D]
MNRETPGNKFPSSKLKSIQTDYIYKIQSVLTDLSYQTGNLFPGYILHLKRSLNPKPNPKPNPEKYQEINFLAQS